MPYSSAPLSSPAFARAQERHWGYGVLLIPVILSYVFVFDPLTSYVMAWGGSVFIFAATVSGKVRPLPNDLPQIQQILRPPFLVHAVFFGFFCFSSVFHVRDLYVSSSTWSALPLGEMVTTAAAQRYYLVGHVAFVIGLLSSTYYQRSGTWQLASSLSFPELLLLESVVAFILGQAIGQIGAFNQFAVKFQSIAGISLVLSFALSLVHKQFLRSILLGAIYVFVLVSSLLSGWKHQVIGVIGLLLVYLLPRYKRSVIAVGLVALALSVTVLPAYNGVFRELNWSGNVEAEDAAAIAFQQVIDGDIDIAETSWTFLKGRTTEIGLFTDYIEHTPQQRPFYGLEIAKQAVLSVIPRAAWSSKPITEDVVMERVFENGAVETYSNVSAKPQLIVDGYLSGGVFGVFLTCFLLGLCFAWASRLCEKYLGGYRFGTAVVYTSLFSTVILTNSFEFFANTFFWSSVTAILIFYGLRVTGWVRWVPHGPPAAKIRYPASLK